jgi:Fur family ferric uptake transcriptional regulator
MSCIDIHSKTLRDRGFRMTAQRVAVLEVLHDGGHLSPAQVYKRVGRTGMNEATVYRTLEFLADNGIIFSTHNAGGHLTYELSSHNHHHLVCRSCGAQVDVEPDLIQKAITQLERQTGYQVNAGHITFFGLCPACQH